MDFDACPDTELPVSHADVERIGTLLQILIRPDFTVNQVDRELRPGRIFRHQLVGQNILQVLVGGVEPADDPVGKQPPSGSDKHLQGIHRGRILALLGDIDGDHTDG